MIIIIISAIVAFLSVYFGLYLDKGKLTGLSIFLFALLVGIFTYWQGIDEKNSEIEEKKRDISLLHEVINTNEYLKSIEKLNREISEGVHPKLSFWLEVLILRKKTQNNDKRRIFRVSLDAMGNTFKVTRREKFL